MHKKLITLAALLLFAIPLHAQLYVGGAVSVSHSGSNQTFSTSFRPDIGYSFGRFAAGVAFLAETYTSLEEGGDKTTNLSLAPYVEYHFWSSDNLSLYVEGGVGHSRFVGFESRYSRWTPYLGLGVSFALTDHWTLEGQLGRLEYDSYFRNTQFNWSGDALSVGLYYTF